MQVENSVSVDTINVTFIATTLTKLVEDNERLKKRVDALEGSLKDRVAALQQENETLQKRLLALISLMETEESEIRNEPAEFKKERYRSENRVRGEHTKDDKRSDHYKASQHCKRFRSSNDKIADCNKNHRDIDTSSHKKWRASPSRHKSHEIRRSEHKHTSTESVERGYRSPEYSSWRSYDNKKSSHERRSIGSSQRNPVGEKAQLHDSKYSQDYYRVPQRLNLEHYNRRSNHQLDSKGDRIRENEIVKRSQNTENNRILQPNHGEEIRSSKEKNIKTPKVEIPSSNVMTFWASSNETMPIIEIEDLKKVYSTPMKFINNLPTFLNYKLVSPLPNTPDQLREKFKEQESIKISPVPLLLNRNRITNKNKEVKLLKEESLVSKIDVKSFSPVSSDSFSEREDKTQSQIKDTVEIQTVIKTDDVEHGVFKRKRRV